MKNTIVTGSLIVFSDGFVWKRLSNEKAYKIWVSAENEDFELYKIRIDDESESLIESLEDLQDAFKQGHYVCIEVGKLPYSIDLNYLRNLQEMSVIAVKNPEVEHITNVNVMRCLTLTDAAIRNAL